ncbi:MAG: MFS transporter [Cytophagales bacterium]|nr:MFS transporter [Cytophagales bacterium]
MSASLYTRQFLLLCASSFFFFASFNMVIPELPSHLEGMGGAEYKGLIIALFTLTAGLSRPFSGKLTDALGRLPVMVVGSVVCVVCGVLYAFANTVFLLLLLRFFHGFSTGFKPTATSAYVADLVPDHKRGEAMGILSMAGGAGMAAGPAVGSLITQASTIHWMFVASSLAALVSVVVILGMKETLEQPKPFHLSLLRIGWGDVYEPRVLWPALVMVFTTFAFGAVLTLIPDYSRQIGVINKGLYFSIFTVSSLFVRIMGGRLSDRHGRPVVVLFAVACVVASLLLLALYTERWSFFLSAVLFGFGAGTNAPTLFAWTTDLADPQRRGRAMAMVYIALELGIGLGSLVSAWVFDNQVDQMPAALLVSALVCALAVVLLVAQRLIKRT